MGASTNGFGIATDTLQNSSYNNHRFYNSSNNLNTDITPDIMYQFCFLPFVRSYEADQY